MSDKQVYELTIDDLDRYSVWFFPMDDTVEDELTVRPLAEQETCSDFQIIVRADFFGERHSVYRGAKVLLTMRITAKGDRFI